MSGDDTHDEVLTETTTEEPAMPATEPVERAASEPVERRRLGDA